MPKLLLFCFLFWTDPVESHGFISQWASDDQKFQKAQKVPLTETSFRPAPDNTGWIGSSFINTPAITCGASITPEKKIAPPSGKLFSSPEQSAKKTLPVKAGGKISVIISGEPGKGFAHHNGNIQTFLGRCGTSLSACENFDAATTSYHRIQAEVDGISNKLIKQFDHQYDGQRWDIPIPNDTPSGSYIMRLELVTFGQSIAIEGHQDQYYVFCGQISVNNPASPADWDTHQAIQFSSGYKTGNIDPKSLPGDLLTLNTTKSSASSSKGEPDSKTGFDSSSKSSLSSKPDVLKGNNEISSSKPKSNPQPKSVEFDNGSHSETGPNSDCADRCYKKKIEEIKSLAQNCTKDQFACLCHTASFIQAYKNCCQDHCKGSKATQAAITEIDQKCAAAHAPTSPSLKRRSFIPTVLSLKDSPYASLSCKDTCYHAKTQKKELGQLAPACKADDFGCLCKSHAWVRSYIICTSQHCETFQEARIARNDLYAVCGV
ncbi:hypothetical protein O181_061793 [Austropuccinia psidii MF-1]|uniref:lytic cellulose monooxygenase (C4-dehydrogenating) n=1 Tax=Austropuccinia psidii MF-1 TaxID=1389203 RepID=A0A9Q3EIP6_9BASI|nr:hypothetical protein [Austropuccinia psidii MF-1]